MELLLVRSTKGAPSSAHIRFFRLVGIDILWVFYTKVAGRSLVVSSLS